MTATLTTSAEQSAIIPLDSVVPVDGWQGVRITLVSVYVVWYVSWFFSRGLIIDRISVAFSVGAFLVCAFIGRPWRRWGWLAVEAALYAAMWFAYEMTRGAGDKLGMPLQVEAFRNVDRAMFLGSDPQTVLQDWWYRPGEVAWYDKVFSATYFTHFIVPVIAMASVWVLSQYQWRRYVKRFATLLAVACIGFVLLPTAPPWMVSSPKYPYQIMEPLARHTSAGFYDLGLKGFVHSYQKALDWGNAVAAMPSLHAGFALFVPAFFLPWIRPRWARIAVFCFPVLMLTSLVYFGEHWVIDGFIGWAIVGGSFWFWSRMERRGRQRRADSAMAALA